MANVEQVVKRVEISAVESDQSFPDTLRALMGMAGMTQRGLSKRCKEQGWGAPSTINYLVRGEIHPTKEAIEAIAEALGEPPETFAEYRLMVARESLDPYVAGLESALEALARFQSAAERQTR